MKKKEIIYAIFILFGVFPVWYQVTDNYTWQFLSFDITGVFFLFLLPMLMSYKFPKATPFQQNEEDLTSNMKDQKKDVLNEFRFIQWQLFIIIIFSIGNLFF